MKQWRRIFEPPRLRGFEEHELSDHPRTWAERLHPEDRERALATLHEFFEGVRPTYELEHRLRHKDGTYRWVIARGLAIRNAAGKAA